MPIGLYSFGTTDDGLTVTDVRLGLPSGLAAALLDRGAVVRDLKIPTRNGAVERVVLRYRDLAGYCADRGYLGALAGRHANRMAGGRFKLDGRIHQLTLNEHGRTHLHGGLIGFSRRGWRILEHTDASVTLGLTSPMSEEGYPGTSKLPAPTGSWIPGP
jgi:aldose 1-epimerase